MAKTPDNAEESKIQNQIVDASNISGTCKGAIVTTSPVASQLEDSPSGLWWPIDLVPDGKSSQRSEKDITHYQSLTQVTYNEAI